MDLSVTVLTWDTPDDTLDSITRCRNELLAMPGVSAELIVLDNGSSGPARITLQRLCAAFKARYIENEMPQAIAPNRNKLFSACQGKYQLSIDGDIVPPKGLIPKMYREIVRGNYACLWGLVHTNNCHKDKIPDSIDNLKEITYMEDFILSPHYTMNTTIYIIDREKIQSAGIAFDTANFGQVGDRQSDLDYGYQMADKGLAIRYFNLKNCYHRWHSSEPMVSAGAPSFGNRIAIAEGKHRDKWGAKLTQLKDAATPGNLSVLWAGNILRATGYGKMNRNIVGRLLKDATYDISINATDRAFVSQAVDDVEWILDNMDKRRKSDIGVVGSPPLAAFLHDCKYKVCLTMMETVDFHPDIFTPRLREFDELWYPTTSDMEKHKKAGLAQPAYLVPLGIDTETYKPREKLALKGLVNKFVFLSIFGWSERKGTDILCKAFLEEFKGRDDVALLVAGVTSAGVKKDIKIKAESQVDQWRRELGIMDKPDIIIMDEVVPDIVMPYIYRLADCYVAVSRGEGWGLPLLEAMACGIPPIAHYAYSHTDFVDEDSALLVDCVGYVKANADMEAIAPYYKDQYFWEPSLDQTREQMGRIVADAALRERISMACRQKALQYTWDNTVSIIKGHLQRIGKGLP